MTVLLNISCGFAISKCKLVLYTKCLLDNEGTRGRLRFGRWRAGRFMKIADPRMTMRCVYVADWPWAHAVSVMNKRIKRTSYFW